MACSYQLCDLYKTNVFAGAKNMKVFLYTTEAQIKQKSILGWLFSLSAPLLGRHIRFPQKLRFISKRAQGSKKVISRNNPRLLLARANGGDFDVGRKKDMSVYLCSSNGGRENPCPACPSRRDFQRSQPSLCTVGKQTQHTAKPFEQMTSKYVAMALAEYLILSE